MFVCVCETGQTKTLQPLMQNNVHKHLSAFQQNLVYYTCYLWAIQINMHPFERAG